MTIECFNFRSHESGALQGFANLKVPKMGVELFGCGVFMKNGKRWLSMPSREYVDPETNEKKYITIMKFTKREHEDAFCQAALKAVDDYCAKMAAPVETDQVDLPDGPVPF